MRYLPLPMVAHLIEAHSKVQNDQDASRSAEKLRHLAIYQKDKHERANLIWNATMREQLKKEILNNCIPFVERLLKFVSEPHTNQSLIQRQSDLPLYEQRI